MSYTVRPSRAGDASALDRFFRAAYGEDTIFAHPPFVRWFFDAQGDDRAITNMIALTPRGEVVAHYGALRATFVLDGEELSMAWGVNAFTLPEHRGAGLGNQLLAPLLDATAVFGVIGFKAKTADFYEKLGFNLFGRARFERHVVATSEACFEAAALVKGDVEALRSRLAAAGVDATPATWANAVDLPPAALGAVVLDDPPRRAGVPRTAEWLRWRFADNPALDYEIVGHDERGVLRGAIVARRERLHPTAHHATRIVDVLGADDTVGQLLGTIVSRARARGDAFVDLGAFGPRYRTALAERGFACLRDDEVTWLPQVTNPVVPRPNDEYLGLHAARRSGEIRALDAAHVWFTRADSDRDRAARRSTLPSRR